MKVQLYDYQEQIKRGVHSLFEEGYVGAALFMRMGTGKSYTSLAIMEPMPINGLIIICTKAKISEWETDLREQCPQLVENSYIINFESCWRDKAKNAILKLLEENNLGLIVDESQKAKSDDSKQSKACVLFSRYSKFSLVLTGTPQNKKYIDYYPQMKIIRSPVYDMPIKEFEKEYCIKELNREFNRPFWEIVGYRNEETLLKGITDQAFYHEYVADYKNPVEIVKKIPMGADAKWFKKNKVWPKMDKQEMEELLQDPDFEPDDTQWVIANKGSKYRIYARESVLGFIREYELSESPKIDWLIDFLDVVDERVVVFTNFKKEVELLMNMCNKINRPYSVYTGSTKDLTNWENEENSVCIVNYQAGAVGINHLVTSHITVFFSPTEDHILHEQAKARTDRIGQTKQPLYYYLQTIGSVEPLIYRSLRSGKDFDQKVFDAWVAGEIDEEEEDV